MKKSILMIACVSIMGAAIAQTKPATATQTKPAATASVKKQAITKEVVANNQTKKAKTQRAVASKQKRQAINSVKNDKGKPAASAHDAAIARKDYRKDKRLRAKDKAALKRDAKKTPPVVKPVEGSTLNN